MAPRKPAEEEEVFTDLQGNPETTQLSDDPLDLADELETQLTESERRREAAEDDDLKVVDDEEETPPGEVEEEIEQPEVAEPEVERGEDVVEFDPKDAQIVIAEFRNLELRETSAKDTLARADADIAAAEKEMETALEAGDSKANVAGTKKFAAAMVAKSNAETLIANLTTEKAGIASRAQAVMAKAPKDAQGKPILTERVVRQATPAKNAGSKLFPDFVKHNKWFNDPNNATKRQILISLDSDLNKEGKLDKNTPAYFDELGKRFNRVHPGLFKTPAGKPIATGTQTRRAGTPIPSGGGGGGTPNRGGFDPKSIKLTNSDLQQMRTFGMDPSKKADKKQWLASLRETARADHMKGLN